VAQAGEPHLLEAPEEIVEQAVDRGEESLRRLPRDILVTAVIGGVEVSLGALAAMVVLGSALQAAPQLHLYGALALGGLVFPIGFLFVILGRSELFTENFLVPVVAVLRSECSPAALLKLWALSWVGNMAGCAVMAAIASIPNAVGKPMLVGYAAYAGYKLSLPGIGVFFSAVLAGMVMTVLTWLMSAIGNPVVKVFAIWAAGYAIFATNLSHTVVSAALVFVGAPLVHRGLGSVAAYIGLCTVGNLVGGVGLVTLFRLAQVKGRSTSQQARGGQGRRVTG
jgi:formate/nitrite transporter FocA (FNT family)